jgi:hypothetical protein
MKLPGRKKLSKDRIKRDEMARELVRSETDATQNTRFPVFSPNPATNLVVAEIVVRGIANVMRRQVEERVAKATYESEDRAREVLDGRTALTSLALYGAARLASRSTAGLGIVAGGLIAKSLYDRGKIVQRRRRNAKLAGTKDETGAPET